MKKQTIQLLIGAIILVALVASVIVYMPNLDAQTLYNWFKDNMGYTLIFLLMAVESSFIPFPSEIVVPPAAYFACSGAGNANINVVMVVLVATLGALVGACVNYVISMFIGRPVVYGFANSRIGHMCLIDAEKVEKAEKYFADKEAKIKEETGATSRCIKEDEEPFDDVCPICGKPAKKVVYFAKAY